MSAVAITTIDEGLFLQCDGYQSHVKTGEILSKSTSKIYKLNNRVAFLNLGSHGDIVQHLMKGMAMADQKHVDPEMTAEALGFGLQSVFQKLGKPREYLNVIVGFNDEGSPELWQLYNGSKRAEEYGFPKTTDPYKAERIDFNSTFASVVGIPPGKTTFDEKLKKYQDKDRRTAAELAFWEMVEEYSQQGYLCGGEIFTETLKPA